MKINTVRKLLKIYPCVKQLPDQVTGMECHQLSSASWLLFLALKLKSIKVLTLGS
jgi:hypothetical protein